MENVYLLNLNVVYLESVVNPEAERVKEALKRQGEDQVKDIKIGCSYQLELEADSEEAAQAYGHALAERLLVNKAMEDYTLSIEEA